MARELYSRNLCKMRRNGFYMKVVLKEIKEKALEKLNGQMEVNIKATLTMMKDVAKEK
jgi:hypothetical protein